ncbi:MAG: hypothetical protein KAT15_06805, partial [Bacteroidales bacterium]|nr:hypothetical protein [Bacteroidales bacterium]
SVLQQEQTGSNHVKLAWDGSDASGNRLKAGIYMYRIYHGSGSYTGKFLVDKHFADPIRRS